MSFSVSFLGHRHELPDGILDYLEYERMASRIMGSSLDLVIEKMEECKARDTHSLIIELEETREPYQMLMISMAEEYVRELIAKGVFDISAIELLERTNGFDELDKLANEVLGRHLEEAKRILSNQLDEVQRAYSSAESSITGSGVSVYTSSALTLMASGVFETGVLRSQAKKADREFNEACSAIEAQATSATARNDAHAIFGEFLPALSELMLDLCNQLLSAFLTELATRDLFDFDSIKGYNLLKAEKMLGNIKLVPDPEVLLNQAFVTCPYCGEIYKWVFSLGMMDEETFSTAETLGLSEELIGELENYCRQNVDKPEVFDRYLSILLEHGDTSRSDAILEMFKDDIEKAEAGYRGLHGLFSEDGHSRDVSIEKMLVKNDELKQASKLIVMDAVEVGRAIEADINSIIGIPIGERLVREGLVGKLHMPVCGDEQTFEQLCKSLVEDAAQLIVDYGDRLHPHVNSCLDSSEAILREITRRKELIAEKRLKASDTIEQLESLKGRLRLRDVDLRWEVDNQANAVRRELEDLIVRCNIESLKKLRVDVVREGDSILSCHLDSSEVKAMGGMHFADIDSSSFDKLLDIETIKHDVERRINPKTPSQKSDQFENTQISDNGQKDGAPRTINAKKKSRILDIGVDDSATTSTAKLPTSAPRKIENPSPRYPYAPTTNEGESDRVAKELRNYKRLLDGGLLTQEEFDAKKAKMLDVRALQRMPEVDVEATGNSAGSTLESCPPNSRTEKKKSKWVAGLTAIFLGCYGVHKFYLGYSAQGAILLAVTLGLAPLASFIARALGDIALMKLIGILQFIPILIGVAEGVIYLIKSEEDFQTTYVAGRREWF